MSYSTKGSNSKIIPFIIILLLLGTCLGNAQEYDYFATARDSSILRDVERYHLGPDNFWMKYRAGQFRLAMDELKFVLRYFPNHPKALSLMGVLAKLTKSPSSVVVYYERALRLYPERAITHAQYGAYLSDIGQNDAGIKKLQKAVEIDPKLNAAYVWLAEAYMKSGKSELAARALEDAQALSYGQTEGRRESYK
jgi:Tfp pilus assembly protein PilF